MEKLKEHTGEEESRAPGREVRSLRDALESALFLPPVPSHSGKGEGPDILQHSHYEANMYFVRHVFMFFPLKAAWERLTVMEVTNTSSSLLLPKAIFNHPTK